MVAFNSVFMSKLLVFVQVSFQWLHHYLFNNCDAAWRFWVTLGRPEGVLFMLFGAQRVQNRVCANARECCDLLVLLNEQIESLARSNPTAVPKLV